MSTTITALARRSGAQLFPFSIGKRAINPLESKAIREKTILGLAKFAEADAASTVNVESAGHVFHSLLAMPLEDLTAFLREYCERTEIEMPAIPDTTGKRGRPMSSGRNLLAACLWAKFPQMLQKAGKRDTLGGKRITACLYRYKRRHGLLKSPEPRFWPEAIPTSARAMLLDLMLAAEAIRVWPHFQKLCQQAWGTQAVRQLQKFAREEQPEEEVA